MLRFPGFLLLLAAIRIEMALATPGAVLYEQQCAKCHGADGRGVAGAHDDPLQGDATIDQLAQRIADTMPEDAPEACVGDDARQVAAFIYHEFYSVAARQSKGWWVAPRVDLARLTVPQHRNAIADLIGSFTPAPRSKAGPPEGHQPGLWGAYYQSAGMNKTDKRVMQRVDSQIALDFGAGSPCEGITADQFAMVWTGSFAAPYTGDYEFRVRTPNGIRLYVNSEPREGRGKLRDDDSSVMAARLIDAWVSSGELREHHARVFLLGGRRYPLRLEFFKYLEETASIELEWKPPHGVWEVLDDRALSTAPAPRTFVVPTAFPADDRSAGYERGSAISPQWHAAIADAALAAADEITYRLPRLAHRGGKSADPGARLASFVAEFASAAFRRPLTSDEETLLTESMFIDSTPEAAVHRAVLYTLTSPHFLYADLTPPGAVPSQHTIATRLALALWDSLPDAALRAAADAGELSSPAELTQQAERMLTDPRAHTKLQGFFRNWLEVEERDLAKDGEMFPEFDEAVIADLRFSLEQFIEDILWSETSDYRQILLADHLLLNRRLFALYGGEGGDHETAPVSDRQFVMISGTDQHRAGVLTHPYLLSAFAYHNGTSPIHRGVFLTRNIMGRGLKPPPVAQSLADAQFPPELTMRQKVTLLTRDQACMSCHDVINPLGFALEGFDAVGRWRTSDNDQPIDTQSDYTTPEGISHTLHGPRDIAQFAIASEPAQRGFVRQLFQYLIQQDPLAYGPNTIEELQRQFVADEFHLRKLVVRIAVRAAGVQPPVPSAPLAQETL
jgi:hypothetical protein